MQPVSNETTPLPSSPVDGVTMGGMTLRDLERERVGAAAVAAVAEETAAAAAASALAAASASVAGLPTDSVSDVFGGREPGTAEAAGVVDSAPEALSSVNGVGVNLGGDNGGGGGSGDGTVMAPPQDPSSASAGACIEAPSEVARTKGLVI